MTPYDKSIAAEAYPDEFKFCCSEAGLIHSTLSYPVKTTLRKIKQTVKNNRSNASEDCVKHMHCKSMERHTCLMIFIFIILGGFSLYAVVTSLYAVTYSLYSVLSPLSAVLL